MKRLLLISALAAGRASCLEHEAQIIAAVAVVTQ